MKMHKRIATLSICMTIIASGLAGCAQSNESIENTSAVETTTAAEITTAVKTEMPTATTVIKTTKSDIITTEAMVTESPNTIVAKEQTTASIDDTYILSYSPLHFDLVESIDMEYMSDFSCGLCAYKDGFTGLYGYIDTNMEVAIEPQFFDALDFHEGYAGVYDGYNWGFIDKSGRYVIEPKYSEILDLNENDYKDEGFINGMALVASAQNDGESIWASSHDDCYYIIDYYGNEHYVDYDTYLDLFYDKLTFCNGIVYVNDLDGKVKILNSDGTINSEKSALFQDIAAYEEYNKCIMLDKEKKDDNVVNYSNSKLVFERSFPPAYTAYVIITDVNKSFVFDLMDLQEFNQLINIEVCDNVLVTQREINDIEQSAVYDYNGNQIIGYKYKDIIPVVIDGNAEYFICVGNNDSSIVVDKNGEITKQLDNYCYIDVMTSYDGNVYLLAVYKNDTYCADIIDLNSNSIITTFSISYKPYISHADPNYEYIGIHKGVILYSREDIFIAYDYINNYSELVPEDLDNEMIFLNTGICGLKYSRDYYRMAGGPLS